MDIWKVSAVVTVLNFVRDSANRDVKEPQIVSNSGEYCGFGVLWNTFLPF